MEVVKPYLRGAAADGAVSEAVRYAGVGCARFARGVAGCEMRACGASGAQGGRRDGMPPHGGFAIGLERITACFLGIANVKECSMFPRDINRVAP